MSLGMVVSGSGGMSPASTPDTKEKPSLTKLAYVSVIKLHTMMIDRFQSLKQQHRDSKSDQTRIQMEEASYLLSSREYLNESHRLKADFHIQMAERKNDKEKALETANAFRQRMGRLIRAFMVAYNIDEGVLPTTAAGSISVSGADLANASVDVVDLKDAPCAECGGAVVWFNYTYTCSGCGVVVSDEARMTDAHGNTLLSYDHMDHLTIRRKDTYRKINHFREFLRQLQGKSCATIPPRVMDIVQSELLKSHTSTSDVNPELVKRKLGKYKLAKYYEFAVSITLKLNPDFRPLQIEPEHEEILCSMFVETLQPYERCKQKVRKERKSYMSYPYVAYKLCQLNGFVDYLSFFRLLKSSHLLGEQDRWWRIICQELGWNYMRTIGNVSGNRNFAVLKTELSNHASA